MPQSSIDALVDLFVRDLDLTLIRRAALKTPTERIEWLEEMQAFADDARKARDDEAARAARNTDG